MVKIGILLFLATFLALEIAAHRDRGRGRIDYCRGGCGPCEVCIGMQCVPTNNGRCGSWGRGGRRRPSECQRGRDCGDPRLWDCLNGRCVREIDDSRPERRFECHTSSECRGRWFVCRRGRCVRHQTPPRGRCHRNLDCTPPEYCSESGHCTYRPWTF